MASEIIKFSIPLAGLKRAESDRKNSQEKLFNGKNPTQQGVEYFMHFIGDFYS
jgi:hypothetical protein